ncbi:hypothetical protein BVRB_033070, partial [Beta vulgaris subsp. vulgaris]
MELQKKSLDVMERGWCCLKRFNVSPHFTFVAQDWSSIVPKSFAVLSAEAT